MQLAAKFQGLAKKIAAFAVVVVTRLGPVVLLVVISANWSNWWWYLTIGRSVTRADQLLADDHADQAIPILREALANHPKDARLYYSLGGAYLAIDNEFAALACFTEFRALYRNSSQTDNGRISRADKVIQELTTPPSYDDVASAKSYADDGVHLLNEAIVTFNDKGLIGWRKQNKAYSLRNILGESAVTPESNPLGLMNPEQFANSGLFNTSGNPVRAEVKTASLRSMILAGAFSVAAPDLGTGCCVVDFSDPDLRQSPYVLKEGLDKAAALNDEERLNRIINLKSRLGIKRRFVYDLINLSNHE